MLNWFLRRVFRFADVATMGSLGGQLGRDAALGVGGDWLVIPGDAAAPITRSQGFFLTKGSAAAISVAAPGAANVGVVLTFVSGSDFAHVITFTGTTLEDGTTGLNTTATFPAFAGASITVVARTATRWSVVNAPQVVVVA